MKRISLLTLTFTVAAFFAACGGAAENKPAAKNEPVANANAAAKPVAAAPTKDALMTIEKAGWEAWKTRDAKWNEENLSAKAVGFNMKDGRQDKAAMMKAFADAKCEVKSYSFSDEQMNMYGNDVAVLNFKAQQDYTCDGKKGPANVWSSSVYVREGDKWKSLLYLENEVVDPKATPKAAPKTAPAAKKDEAKPAETKPDALTETLMAVETKAWDAWKTRDAKAQDAVMAAGFMYVGATGRYDRAAALKLWSEPKCTPLSFTFSDPKGIQVTPDVTLVTHKADVTGTCDGAPVPPHLWVASFDTKEGDVWKNAFYTDVAR